MGDFHYENILKFLKKQENLYFFLNCGSIFISDLFHHSFPHTKKSAPWSDRRTGLSYTN